MKYKRNMNSLTILREINSKIKERHFHEHTYILYDIRTSLGPEEKTYLEIGSYVGSSGSLILSHPFPTKVYCVDPCVLNPIHYQGDLNQYDTLERNLILNKKSNSFEIIKDYSCSTTTLEKFKNLKIDLLFIDGDHSRKAVFEDFNNYINLVSEGGYIVFDDYLDSEYSPEVRKSVDDIVENLDSKKYKIIGSGKNVLNAKPLTFKNLNEFVIQKNNYMDEKLFAIVIPTYQRKNGSTPKNIKNVIDFLSKQTYQNYKVFLIGDDYEDNDEFQELVSLFPKGTYSYNNKKSYRKDYFTLPLNRWGIGGVMALHHGVEKAKELGYKYYLHLDDDDSWTLDKLEKHKKAIDQFPYSDFIFHASKYGKGILPREHSNIKTLEYNNLKPRGANIVHSSNCLSLNDKSYNLFTKFTNNIMMIAEKIKNKEIPEHQIQPFDLQLANLLTSQDLNFLYIPKVLTIKENDCNIPE
jgi:predicted O-methyltransferase YrrM